jgi:hypothetical protein
MVKGGRGSGFGTYLEDVIVLEPLCSGDLLRYGHRVCEVFVWKFVELCCVV